MFWLSTRRCVLNKRKDTKLHRPSTQTFVLSTTATQRNTQWKGKSDHEMAFQHPLKMRRFPVAVLERGRSSAEQEAVSWEMRERQVTSIASNLSDVFAALFTMPSNVALALWDCLWERQVVETNWCPGKVKLNFDAWKKKNNCRSQLKEFVQSDKDLGGKQNVTGQCARKWHNRRNRFSANADSTFQAWQHSRCATSQKRTGVGLFLGFWP